MKETFFGGIWERKKKRIKNIHQHFHNCDPTTPPPFLIFFKTKFQTCLNNFKPREKGGGNEIRSLIVQATFSSPQKS